MSGPSRDRVTVRVPGSTSNCGAGFDTLGLALALYNRVTLLRAPAAAGSPPLIAAADAGSAPAQEMVEEAAELFFARAGVSPHGFTYLISGDVPPARGLGSSITVRAGVLAGLNAFAGDPVDRFALAALATELEGHPDNATAGVLGGFCVPRTDPHCGALRDCLRAPVGPGALFIVASPAVEVLTKESRGRLPAQLPYADAVRSINSAAFLTAAFLTGDYPRLRGAVSDFLHEPYRLPHIRGGAEAIAAGVGAGAWTGWLSGSGSSVLCVAPPGAADAVAAAMTRAFHAAGIPSVTRALPADNDGLIVEPA